jgi:hypothetical protein
LKREDEAYNKEKANAEVRIQAAKDAAKVVESGGWVAAKASGSSVNEEYEAAKAKYVSANGDANDFESMVRSSMTAENLEEAETGEIGVGKYKHFNNGLPFFNDPYGHAEGVYNDIWYSYQ